MSLSFVMFVRAILSLKKGNQNMLHFRILTESKVYKIYWVLGSCNLRFQSRNHPLHERKKLFGLAVPIEMCDDIGACRSP